MNGHMLVLSGFRGVSGIVDLVAHRGENSSVVATAMLTTKI